ncbi:hypothetical protein YASMINEVIRUS_937 [Yasminevirus sp. GU-2018]|uniref:Uncharacterized protein n=1 Tax=Yasminevirus sp. GU-2018 TaxID=2420051 RepID=A0A5K0UAH7_9VIRU|nr:hypothetical protein YASMINEVIRUS_937 [Yasminevirus sp. GU-2018]
MSKSSPSDKSSSPVVVSTSSSKFASSFTSTAYDQSMSQSNVPSNLSNGLSDVLSTKSSSTSDRENSKVSSTSHKSSSVSVSTGKSSSKPDRKAVERLMKGGGYKIILQPDDAELFIKEIRKIKASSSQEKTTIDVKNANEYIDVAKHIKSALNVLQNDVSREKAHLEELYNKFKKLGTNNMFYKFSSGIPCHIVINGERQKGNLIAIDDGVSAVAQSVDGSAYIVTVEGQIEILEKNPVKEDQNGGAKKSIFTPSSTRSSKSSRTSSINTSIHTSIDTSIDTSIESSARSSDRSSAVSSTRSSAKLSSSVRSSEKISSPPTEELSSSSANVKSSSPYLATSEYDIVVDSVPKEDPRTSPSVPVSSSNKQSDKASSEEVTTPSNNSSNSSSNSRPDKSSENEVDSVSSSAGVSTSASSSNRSEFEFEGSKFMRGGSKKSTKTESDKKGIRFMKAGRSDSVGIIESSKNGSYYSESSSAIEGLCE